MTATSSSQLRQLLQRVPVCLQTETALLQTLDEVFTAADNKQVSVMICLDSVSGVRHSRLYSILFSSSACSRSFSLSGLAYLHSIPN